MIVGGQTEARAQLSSTIIDYHEPFDQGFSDFHQDCQIQGMDRADTRLSQGFHTGLCQSEIYRAAPGLLPSRNSLAI